MILGYDQPRPRKEHYEDFEKKLVSGLQTLGIDGLSLMIYGSYIRGDYNPGRSDIDSVLIFPGDVAINKEHLGKASVVLSHALQNNHIPFQVTVTDLATMQDGRFNTYDPSFVDYFRDEGKIVVGPDYRNLFRYELPTMSDQVPVAFNLRKSRMGLFFADYDRETDYRTFLTRFNKTLDAVSRGSKQILHFMDGQLRKNRFSAGNAIREIMPEISTEPLERIKILYHEPSKLDALYKKPDELLTVWNSAVTFFEQMIKGYLDRVPHS